MGDAKLAVEDIIEDLSDRRGLGHEWGSIDEDIQDGIRETWARFIEARISAAVAEEREACAKLAEDFLDMTYTPDRIADLIRARSQKGEPS